MTEGKAQDLVNGAALVVAAIYFYRKLIEPSSGANAATSSAGTGATPEGGPTSILASFKGPGGAREIPGEPASVGAAAAQLFGKGKPAPTERFVVGWGFVFLTLSLAVPVAPELAGAFAALVALGAILGNGTQVASDLETQLHHEAKPEAATSAASASPTTTVSFAGAAAMTPAVFPQAAAGAPKKTGRKKKRSTLPIPVEST